MEKRLKRLGWYTSARAQASRASILILGAGLAFLPVPRADAGCQGIDCVYDPQPAPDDYAIPMPGGFSMIFRKVEVPGPEFWGNPDRLVFLGDVTGIVANDPEGVFEPVHKQPITGAFPEAGQWVYYLGKYEVSIGQYASVMGAGDLEKGIQAYIDRADLLDDKKLKRMLTSGEIKSRDRALAEPLRLISWFDYQEFMHRYNQWCLSTESCRSKLPSLPERLGVNTGSTWGSSDLTIGFFRLPTEVEWEYAARGGLQAIQAKTYEEPLPFPRAEAGKYATIKDAGGHGPTQIGKHAAANGFHDMLGNLSELTAEPFRTESIQGKAGGLTTRGGNYLREGRALRVAERTEEPLYIVLSGSWEAKRFSTVGIRLTIGSLVVSSVRFRDDIVAEHEKYLKGVWPATPAGMTLQDDVIIAKDQALAEAQELLQSLKRANPGNADLSNRISKINQRLVVVDKKIEEGVGQVIDTLVRNALVLFDAVGWHVYRIDKAQQARDTIMNAPISGKTAMLVTHDRNIERLKDDSKMSLDAYFETVLRLRGYPVQVVQGSIQEYDKNKGSGDPKIKAMADVLTRQVGGPYDSNAWRQQVEAVALRPGLFGN